MNPAFAKTYRVASYDVGPNSRLTIPALLRSLHDVAQQHAGSVGFGYRDLLSRNLAWALVTIELSLKPSPIGEDDMVLATSVAKSRGPLVYRDYLGEVAGSAFVIGQSLWALIDLKTRRTTPLPADLKLKLAAIQQPIQIQIDQVKRFGGKIALPIVDQRKVRPHDCDFNGHLNNVVTARWMLDAAYGKHPSLSETLTSLKLSYHQEALVNEKLSIGFNQTPEKTFLEVRNNKDQLIASGEFVGDPT